MDWNSIIYGFIILGIFSVWVIVRRRKNGTGDNVDVNLLEDSDTPERLDEYDDFNNKREPMD